MLFQSLQFILFFFPVFILNLVFANFFNSQDLRRILLVISSAIFYMSWNVSLFFLLAASIFINFYIGNWIAASSSHKTRKLLLLIAIAVQLVILALFKYANFGIESALVFLSAVGLAPSSPIFLDIILPLGISFYTFQGMSYVIDVYREKYRPYQSLLDFFLYISFFVQLIAGPIVRADFFRKNLVKADFSVSVAQVSSGLFLFVMGVFKKSVLADNAAKIADLVFLQADDVPSLMVLLGIYCFAFQIYFDFSGYTDMARGLARMLGFELPINFSAPYLARGLRDFWKRWHISLSTWLRDYLYISLGGSRVSTVRTYINLMLTMLLGGLWHGASFNFVIWGGIHGLFLSIEHAFSLKTGPNSTSNWVKVLTIFLTFHVVCFAWIFFRAPDFDTTLVILNKLVEMQGYLDVSALQLFKPQNWGFGLILPAVVVFAIEGRFNSNAINLEIRHVFWRAAFFTSLLFLILLTSGGANEFVYFQF